MQGRTRKATSPSPTPTAFQRQTPSSEGGHGLSKLPEQSSKPRSQDSSKILGTAELRVPLQFRGASEAHAQWPQGTHRK